MLIENSFVVPVEVERVWEHLLDVECVVPCIPGARITEIVDDDHWKGEMALKLGPMSLAFAGTVVIDERDDVARSLVMVAQGKDRKGKGAARMRSVSKLTSVDGGTEVALRQEIKVTGAIAQFGRGVMQDVSNRMIRDFADALRDSIAARDAASRASGGLDRSGRRAVA